MISWSIWALINRLIQQKKEWCKRSTTPHSICLRIQLHRYIVCINYYESVTVHNLMDVHLFVHSKATEAFFNWYICCCFHFRWPIIPFKFYSRKPCNNTTSISRRLLQKSLYHGLCPSNIILELQISPIYYNMETCIKLWAKYVYAIIHTSDSNRPTCMRHTTYNVFRLATI